MYKLFLCLRYLRSRIIAYFAMLGVALCVAMMVIAVSVMTGFLNKIEIAAKGLFGDIIVDTSSLAGLAWYDEFIDKVVKDVPQVEAGSPFIMSVGILQLPGFDHRQVVQIAGIRLPQRAQVTDIEKGMFVQPDWAAPTFDPPIADVIEAVHADEQKLIGVIQKTLNNETPPTLDEANELQFALDMHERSLSTLAAAEPYQQTLDQLSDQLDAARKAYDQAATTQLDQASQHMDAVAQELADAEKKAGVLGPDRRVMLGLGLRALSYRTANGETVRLVLPGHQLALTLVPLGQLGVSYLQTTPVRETFTVIDDIKTDVSSIDSQFVYVPFDTLQRITNMGAQYSADQPGTVAVPPRTNQIHFKVASAYSEGKALAQVAATIKQLWHDFSADHPQPTANPDISVETWRQRQADIISNIDRQRTLVVTMFAIISLVSVVLIFVIFYMIVFQKTRDIGVLKAIGASSPGVAGIFLIWGAAVGMVGAGVGTGLGYLFVRNINPIQDWIAATFGFRVWSKEFFLFETIPNQVDWNSAILIAVGAILAGLLGALVPAIRAARMQPVEALRYE